MASMSLMQTSPNFNPAMPAFGALLCILLASLLVLGLMVFVSGTIAKKAGYSFWLGLLILIPLGGIIVPIIFAFTKWPIERELEHYRSQVGYSGQGFPVAPSNMPR